MGQRVWILSGTSYAPYFRAGIATLPDNFRYDYPQRDYIGPLLANLDLPVDEQIQAHMRRPGRHIYFAIGSSGEKDLYLRALHALARTGHNIIAAYTTILGPGEIPSLGEHVLLRKLLPAEPVSRMTDLAVLHGGQGTVYTAAYAGRPVAGIPMQFEQQYNIDMLVRHGTAIRISKNRFRERDLIAAVGAILSDYETFRGRAAALAARLPAADGARQGARRIREIAEETATS